MIFAALTVVYTFGFLVGFIVRGVFGDDDQG